MWKIARTVGFDALSARRCAGSASVGNGESRKRAGSPGRMNKLRQSQQRTCGKKEYYAIINDNKGRSAARLMQNLHPESLHAENEYSHVQAGGGGGKAGPYWG